MNIGKKLGVGFGVVIILLIVLSFTGISQLKSVINGYQGEVLPITELRDRSRMVEISILEVRRSEKDFIQRKDLKYVDRVNLYLDKADDVLTIITDETNNGNVVAGVDDIRVSISNYRSEFEKLKQTVVERGLTENDGAQSNFRGAVHHVHELLTDNPINGGITTYLNLRKEEKDYMLRGDSKYIDNVHKVLENLRAQVQSAPLGRTTKSNILESMDEYNTAFNSLVEKDNEIVEHLSIMKENADQAIEMAKTQSRHAEEILVKADTDIAASANSSEVLLMIISIIAVIFGVAAGILLSRMITIPLKKIVDVANSVSTGNLDLEVDIHQQDEIGELADSFREMTDALKGKAKAAQAIANGDLGVEIAVASNQDVLGKAMVAMRDQVNALIDETKSLIQAMREGKLSTRGKDDNFEGAWKDLVSGINDLIEAFVHPIRVTADYVDSISKGNIPEKITDEYKGDFNTTKDNLNTMIDVIGSLLEETSTLAQYSEDGKLDKRGDASKFEGGWATLVSGINDILDAVIKPIQEAQSVLESMAANDLTDSVTGDYKGDHARIKGALNDSLGALNEILSQVSVSIEQVSSGAGQVSSASQSLSQGATEQAASLEEISASIEQIGAQTKQNAENASVANQLGEVAGKAATLGNEHMQQMLNAMTEISESSGQVQKIIKVIDEIAFQTNLLALNAAVEAARAGVHGKGFAVVAEEVRNLAQRSAKAASETTELIEGSVAKTENGGRIAEDTAKALGEISDGVIKMTDIIGEIDSASREQSTAINEVSQAVTQIDQVTQSNTASAEESAAAAEELAGQAAQLKDLISNFKLAGVQSAGYSNGSSKMASTGGAMPLSHDNILLDENGQSEGELAIELPDVEDSDFGDF